MVWEKRSRVAGGSTEVDKNQRKLSVFQHCSVMRYLSLPPCISASAVATASGKMIEVRNASGLPAYGVGSVYR